MLKEGWNVKNVTTIVGLRPYSAKSNILPEQTLGRGLRRMYDNSDIREQVSVIGTDAFMDFIDSVKSEGVELETHMMSQSSVPIAPLVIEIDRKNKAKDIEKLNIHIPTLSPRIYRNYCGLINLDPAKFSFDKIEVTNFDSKAKKEITFRDMLTGDITHVTNLGTGFFLTKQNIFGYYVDKIRRDLRLVGNHDILYGKLKNFVENHLFKSPVSLNNLNILKNLTEPVAARIIYETFSKGINEQIVQDKGTTEIKKTIIINEMPPFPAMQQKSFIPKNVLLIELLVIVLLNLNLPDFLIIVMILFLLQRTTLLLISKLTIRGLLEN